MIVIVPDTAPLIHLAAGDFLDVLSAMGRVVIPDVVALEATRLLTKDFAPQIAAWLATGAAEIVETEIGALYRLAIERGMKAPRHAGEVAIIEWLHDHLANDSEPALVVYEDRRVPRMVAQEPELGRVAVLTTLSFLELAQETGLIASAEAAWRAVIAKAPTASSASTRTPKKPAS